jgi:hypothetical protein
MGMHIAGNSPAIKLATIVSLMLGLAVSARKASAVIIVPGQALTPVGSGAFVGTLLADTGPETFQGVNGSNAVVFFGQVDSQVYRDSSTGDLDFLYQFSNNANSPDSIESLTVGNYAPFTTDADYIPATGTTPPSQVTRSGSGNNVGFEFPAPGAVAPGTNTDDLVIKTNATNFTTGIGVIQDGGNGAAAVYVPSAPVPEPTTVALAGAAVLMLGFRRRYGQPR